MTPNAVLANGDGPTALVMAGNYGDEYRRRRTCSDESLLADRQVNAAEAQTNACASTCRPIIIQSETRSSGASSTCERPDFSSSAKCS